MKQSHLLGLTKSTYCPFCKIIRREEPAHIIFENEHILVFLDKKPLFTGHCLLIPKNHIENFDKLPLDLLRSLFEFSQILSKAVENSMKANGTFIAINNKVSQSVPHVHIHIVPRRPKDGLKGFFWPRTHYISDEHMENVQKLISTEIKTLLGISQ